MRLWSIHPQYLDRKGLLALWREALLAQHVLAGKTVGYKNHPQLNRFRATSDPMSFIGAYLTIVAREAERRGYRFDQTKIIRSHRILKRIPVTHGQLVYERSHLIRKLAIRDKKAYLSLRKIEKLKAHPIFRPVKGAIHDWEKLRE